MPYPQQFGKRAPIAVKAITQVFRQTDFANDARPFLPRGCDCLLDDVQQEFRWGFHATGEPVEVRLVDGLEAFLPAQIEREAVVLDVVNRQ